MTSAALDLSWNGPQGTRRFAAAIKSLVVAGWTGRDRAAMEAHIAELERLGVARPKSTPIFYRVAASLLTTADAIQVAGGDTSGEIEPVLLSLADGLWVTVGSDHTDRKIETMGVTVSKQLCAKPVSAALWRYEEVAAHWDRLVLRAHAVRGGRRELYQEGPVARIRHPEELMAMYLGRRAFLPPGTAMLCGTLKVAGEIAPAEAFEIALEDPVLGRRLEHRYRIETLPVEG
jgi:hypothetical protein